MLFDESRMFVVLRLVGGLPGGYHRSVDETTDQG